MALALGCVRAGLGTMRKKNAGGQNSRFRAGAKHVRAFCENSITHPPVRPLKAINVCGRLGPMSVGRGLFRGWIFLTVLWLIGAGTLAYFITRDEVSHWKWQYVHEARTNTLPGEVDWSRPYYEMMRSPSAENLAVTFMELEYQYTPEWDQFVKDGKLKIVKMPDDSLLYFSTDLTEQDQLYLAKAFWDQRWWRYVSFIKFWGPVLVVPPIVLFILGWAILWVCRGFKTA